MNPSDGSLEVNKLPKTTPRAGRSGSFERNSNGTRPLGEFMACKSYSKQKGCEMGSFRKVKFLETLDNMGQQLRCKYAFDGATRLLTLPDACAKG